MSLIDTLSNIANCSALGMMAISRSPQCNKSLKKR